MLLLDAFYILVLIVLSPWWLLMLVTKPAFRAGFIARFTPRNHAMASQPLIWLHGSSAGEINLLRPLASEIEARAARHVTLVSAFAVSGYTAAKKAFPEAAVIYFPVDFSPVIRRFLNVFRPCLIVLVESELWPNFIGTAAKRGIPVCVLNGRMSEKSFRMHRRAGLIQRALGRISLCAVQTEDDASRFRELGVPESRLRVTGNMKYDAGDVSDYRETARGLREHYGLDTDLPLIVGGSLHRGEEDALAWAYQRLLAAGCRARLIIVPRYPAESAAMAGILQQHGLVPVRKTALGDAVRDTFSDPRRVLLVDILGELKKFYAMSDIVFVGGSLLYRGRNKGGHNLMEPAICEAAVMFGPHNYSFRDTARELLEHRAAVLVHDRDDIHDNLQEFLQNPGAAADMGARARQVIMNNRGATSRNLALLENYLPLS